MGARIRARSLERTFDDGKAMVHALGPVDLDVEDGEFVCVVGPSGCGKSTLLRVMAGLVNPSQGTMEIAHVDPQRPLTGVVFQDHSVFPWKSVEVNIRYGLDIIGSLSRAERKQRARHYVELLGLGEFGDAYPHTLSGGMRQRVAIARALAVEPEVLLMDEPFAALDAQMRLILQDELVSLWERDRRTVVFVTHSIEEALFLGDRILVMSARPGVIREDIRVPFPRPRTRELRGDPEFGRLHEQIWDVLRDEVDVHMGRAS